MNKYSELQNPRVEFWLRDIMTPREAAGYLNVHVRTIYRLAKKGEIPGRKVGGSWRFKKTALDEWFSERKNPSPSEER